MPVKKGQTFVIIIEHIYLFKSAYRPMSAHQAGAHPSFCSTKRLGIFLFRPGWDASPSQDFAQLPKKKKPWKHGNILNIVIMKKLDSSYRQKNSCPLWRECSQGSSSNNYMYLFLRKSNNTFATCRVNQKYMITTACQRLHLLYSSNNAVQVIHSAESTNWKSK